ncbi:chemotaxis protein CheW [Desulfobotulus mexicanus]|uniref:Purine-binding chemotaxis protein CheW n=1 Tax=Desulfobotulus mexicanus TaxID=2586642 RepID=A0A5Q4VEF7_9BACT|nr:chemotaxis protein CheW [Desulfobotulus mexicanus]TYT75338.1 purine-binding chemotaxis protein CheW [Desulfobotulus mexicanus]
MAAPSILELATFYVGETLCGIDILNIKEMNNHTEITPVPGSEDWLVGVMNLRGRILTVMDMGLRLGLLPVKDSRTLVVGYEDEHLGLLVGKIEDVVIADSLKIEPPPSNLSGVQGRFFKGVFKTDKKLIGLLDLKTILET